MPSSELVPDQPYPRHRRPFEIEPPTQKDLEVAIIGQVYFAKRVMVTDPRHGEFHAEINLLLDEWQELATLAGKNFGTGT